MSRPKRRTVQEWYYIAMLISACSAGLWVLVRVWADGDRPVRHYVVAIVRDSLECCREGR